MQFFEIQGLGGDKSLWKRLKGYGIRSLVETHFSGLKMAFRERVSSKKFNHIETELIYRVFALNQMAKSCSFS